ncbi:MAG: TniQ family protein [Anaerolineae bacterium]|nr:TniQ family protein [Anaerolineae bacterium]MCO5193073.1 TniQ family protein [Anaerolineae bacterium]MCO5206199.1 TniQ family protein [Anaerolineae bacterium]
MDELNLTFARPERSYLYSPEPLGLGTGMVESLASYLARLASSHYVSATDLLRCLAVQRKESVPKSERWEYLLTQLQSRRLNAMQMTASHWSQLVAAQTQRKALDQLTLLPWRDLVTPRQITHWSQCWCPCCLEEWKRKGKSIYWPLLWSIRIVTVCPLHQRPLENHCDRCQKQIPALACNTPLGFCPKCGNWLGAAIQTKTSDRQQNDCDEAAQELAERILRMLAVGQSGGQDVTLEKLSRLLCWCQQKANCRQIDLVRGLEIEPPFVVYRLISQKNLITIPILLTILDGLGVTPYHFMTKQFEEIVTSGCMQQFVGRLPNKEKKRVRSRLAKGQRATPELLADVEKRLTAALKEEMPPSLTALSRELGLTTVKVLKRHYPEMCRAIVNKRRVCFDFDLVGDYLKELIGATEMPPTLNEIAKQLQTSAVTLRANFPEEMAALVARRKVIPDVADFSRQVAAFLEVMPPLPLIEVAAQLGVAPYHIRLHCPKLRQEIVKRHTDYIHERSLERKRQRATKVRESVSTLHAQGEYPTKTKVAKMFGREQWQILVPDESEAFTEAMRDLGV